MSNRLSKMSVTNTKEIYQKLVDEILTCKWMPGDIISENMLAERFCTSRTSIRVVLQKLEQDMYVVIIPQKGTFVTFLDYQRISSSMFIRFHTEYAVLKILLEVMTPEIESELRSIVNQYKVVREDAQDFLMRNRIFHRAMFKAAKQECVWEILQKIESSYLRYRFLSFKYIRSSASNFYKEHMDLIDTLVQKDCEQLYRQLYVHIFIHAERLKNILGDNWGLYFIS